MNCAACKERLDEYRRLLLPASEAEQVHDHLTACEKCHAELLEAKMVGDLLRSVKMPEPKPEYFEGLPARVVDRIRQELQANIYEAKILTIEPKPKRGLRAIPKVRWIEAVAAVLLVVFGVTFLVQTKDMLRSGAQSTVNPVSAPVRRVVALGDEQKVRAKFYNKTEEKAASEGRTESRARSVPPSAMPRQEKDAAAVSPSSGAARDAGGAQSGVPSEQQKVARGTEVREAPAKPAATSLFFDSDQALVSPSAAAVSKAEELRQPIIGPAGSISNGPAELIAGPAGSSAVSAASNAKEPIAESKESGTPGEKQLAELKQPVSPSASSVSGAYSLSGTASRPSGVAGVPIAPGGVPGLHGLSGGAGAVGGFAGASRLPALSQDKLGVSALDVGRASGAVADRSNAFSAAPGAVAAAASDPTLLGANRDQSSHGANTYSYNGNLDGLPDVIIGDSPAKDKADAPAVQEAQSGGGRGKAMGRAMALSDQSARTDSQLSETQRTIASASEPRRSVRLHVTDGDFSAGELRQLRSGAAKTEVETQKLSAPASTANMKALRPAAPAMEEQVEAKKPALGAMNEKGEAQKSTASASAPDSFSRRTDDLPKPSAAPPRTLAEAPTRKARPASGRAAAADVDLRSDSNANGIVSEQDLFFTNDAVSTTSTNAATLFYQAEDARLGSRYAEALDLYERASAASPSSEIAAQSQLKIGEISTEAQKSPARARAAYQRCLTPELRKHLDAETIQAIEARLRNLSEQK